MPSELIITNCCLKIGLDTIKSLTSLMGDYLYNSYQFTTTGSGLNIEQCSFLS